MPDQTRVLYVTDDPGSLWQWTELLEAYDDLELQTAQNMPEAVATIADTDIDCILSDLMTPQQNLEFVQTVTSRDPQPQFFLFTEHESDKVINNAIKAGAADYIPKSIARTSRETFLKRLHGPSQPKQRKSNRMTNSSATKIEIGTPGDPEQSPSLQHDSDSESESRGEKSESATDPLEYTPASGTSTLFQCKSHDEQTHEHCVSLSRTSEESRKNLILIRYSQIGERDLSRVVQQTTQTTLIAIGYTQSVPPDIESELNVIEISNPTDLTRLGIVTTGVVQNQHPQSSETALCFDSVSALLRYKSVKEVFKFLHVLLAKLQSAQVTSHFHIDHSTEDQQDVNSLKPIFDNVITVTSNAITIESELS